MGRIDLNSVTGIALGLGTIVVAQVLEGAHLGSLLQLAAFLIVVGGTAGAILLQNPVKTFIRGIKMAAWVFVPPTPQHEALMRQLVNWSRISYREGVLALERYLGTVNDPMAKRGLQLVIDGGRPEAVRWAMGAEIAAFENSQRQAARIWDAAGGYAPTIGIIGAVLGLIHVMENLSDPARLGSGIAVAFVATVYGVGLANLLFLPIASKLRTIIAEDVALREMLMEGLVGIAQGERPRELEARLQAYTA